MQRNVGGKIELSGTISCRDVPTLLTTAESVNLTVYNSFCLFWTHELSKKATEIFSIHFINISVTYY
jgi:hypothetical protein